MQDKTERSTEKGKSSGQPRTNEWVEEEMNKKTKPLPRRMTISRKQVRVRYERENVDHVETGTCRASYYRQHSRRENVRSSRGTELSGGFTNAKATVCCSVVSNLIGFGLRPIQVVPYHRRGSSLATTGFILRLVSCRALTLGKAKSLNDDPHYQGKLGFTIDTGQSGASVLCDLQNPC